MYRKYVGLFNVLSELYDQTLQMQHYNLIEVLINSVGNRMLMWKDELEKISMSECISTEYPPDTHLRPFFHFWNTRDEEVQELLKFSKAIEEPEEEFSLEEATIILKAHEKARQARIFLLNLQTQPDKFRIKKPSVEELFYDFNFDPDLAPLYKVDRLVYKHDCSKGNFFKFEDFVNLI